MDDRELLKALNGIKFDEDEIEECLNYDGISIDELKYKSSNLVTKSSQEYFEEQKKLVKTILDEGETMKAYIKGANIELLRMGALVSAGTFKTNDTGFNYSMFVTQKRVFYCDMNYYNSRTSDFKVFGFDDIEDITFNKVGFLAPKDVRKAWKGVMHPSMMGNAFLSWAYIGGSLVVFGTLTKIFGELFSNLSGTYNEVASIASTLFIMVSCFLLHRHFTKFKLRVSIKTKAKDYFDFIVVNSDHKYVLKVLKELKSKITK